MVVSLLAIQVVVRAKVTALPGREVRSSCSLVFSFLNMPKRIQVPRMIHFPHLGWTITSDAVFQQDPAGSVFLKQPLGSKKNFLRFQIRILVVKETK